MTFILFILGQMISKIPVIVIKDLTLTLKVIFSKVK